MPQAQSLIRNAIRHPELLERNHHWPTPPPPPKTLSNSPTSPLQGLILENSLADVAIFFDHEKGPFIAFARRILDRWAGNSPIAQELFDDPWIQYGIQQREEKARGEVKKLSETRGLVKETGRLVKLIGGSAKETSGEAKENSGLPHTMAEPAEKRHGLIWSLKSEL
ncbi:hypothetical protein K432DRAFT_398992 [Lepidopterella palustris CBS 459.81]|uniref:Uncharacterized protein n=1 Tax=Lepidopterella palustris CBS 459.81 TaxID=1314670 RepID=A0A8E2DX67_9PEZI|nr:hypothetical protein K432DRAFT_398992 [Lepidopterella palustris CBS 459.81]